MVGTPLESPRYPPPIDTGVNQTCRVISGLSPAVEKRGFRRNMILTPKLAFVCIYEYINKLSAEI